MADSLQVISPVIAHLLHLAAQLPPLPLQLGPGVPQDGVDPGQVGLDVGEGSHHLLVVVAHPARCGAGETGEAEQEKPQPGSIACQLYCYDSYMQYTMIYVAIV